MERVKGIEPSYAAWEAAVLPLNYTRAEAILAKVRRYHWLVIEVTVNGAAHQFERPLDVAALLARLALQGKKLAVERNGEIVPKGAHASTLVADGDRLEIVVAVGGG